MSPISVIRRSSPNGESLPCGLDVKQDTNVRGAQYHNCNSFKMHAQEDKISSCTLRGIFLQRRNALLPYIFVRMRISAKICMILMSPDSTKFRHSDH
ncbi:hypothetical protein CEXT_634401 [Caerostris extrusa]|uniref:Uncharacterized protein n=1 Tax=Caerostris extrusa TaxID=172846 RepID=A0AAV4QNI0_CAEEX|nr:hypothetical protein CEXT_634401 [Caerostris extrusa]